MGLFSRRELLSLAGGAGLVLASGCGGGGTLELATLRFFNGLVGPGLPNGIRLVWDGSTEVSLLAHGAGSTFRDRPFGTRTVQAVDPATGGVIATADISVTENRRYLITLSGVVGGAGAAAPVFTVIPIPDPSALISPSGTSLVRLVNLSPDTPAVQMMLVMSTATVVIPGIGPTSYGGASDFASFDANSVRPALRVPGTPTDLSLATSLSDAFLHNKEAYTVVLTGMQNPSAGQQPLNAAILVEKTLNTGTSPGSGSGAGSGS